MFRFRDGSAAITQDDYQTIKSRDRTHNPVFKSPEGCSIRNIHRVGQTAETLVAQAIQKQEFHPFIRVIIEALQDQNPNHGLGGKGRASTP